jgi:para-nitrobenzyl esterase
VTDWMMRRGCLQVAGRRAAQTAAPTYLYLFSWRSPAVGGKYGAFHGVEHPFVFHHLDSAAGLQAGPAQKPLESAVSGAWVAFARSSDPNHADLSRWPAISHATLPTMWFDTESHIVPDLFPREGAAIRQISQSWA